MLDSFIYGSYYAQNYDGVIGWSLLGRRLLTATPAMFSILADTLKRQLLSLMAIATHQKIMTTSDVPKLLQIVPDVIHLTPRAKFMDNIHNKVSSSISSL